MRVLVVDQDSASNLGVTRSLRDLYTVDCVTNKAACLDLLRSNSFEVIVATERLEDGSGLELLGQISKKWPSVLRIFAADRQRLQLLRGRLGPFELFQTLAYPIDADKLLAALQKAAATRGSDSREVELPSDVPAQSEGVPDTAQTPEAPPEAPFELSALDEPLDFEQSAEFAEPRFARVGRAEPLEASSSGRGFSVASRAGSVSGAGTTSGASRGSGARRARRMELESGQPESDLAAKFPGSGTFGPRRGGGGGPREVPRGELRDGASGRGTPGRASRSGRERSVPPKGLPVRFPPLNRTSPVERPPPVGRVPTSESALARNAGGDFSEAATLARAARFNYESSAGELETKRLASLIGAGVAVLAVVLFLGFRMFGSKGEAPKPAAPPVVSHAPEYPPEVTQLVALTEEAFKADDFKSARADVERLRQLSPSHPRLEFFQSLLSGAKGGVSGHGAGISTASSSKKHGTRGGGPASAAAKSDLSTRVSKNDTDVSTRSDSASVAAPPVPSGPIVPAGSAVPVTPSTTTASPAETTGLMPETPVGITRGAAASADVGSADVGKVSTAGEGTAATASSGSVAEVGAAPAIASAGAATTSAPTSHRGAGEPPPVVQEAKLIRRVNPDYPSAARRDGTIGSVDLEVTVSPQGVVENASVLQATPPGVFDNAAMAAVRKWKYDPRFVDGLPAQAHLKVHLEFGPSK